MSEYQEGQVLVNPKTGEKIQLVGNEWKTVTEKPSALHTGEVGLNALYKGAASAADTLLNTPTNIANLGIAAYGAAKGALGGKDLPEPMQSPDYIRRGLQSIGLIRSNIEPQGTRERIVDVAGQAAGGSVAMPGAGLQNVLRNAALGGLSGVISQGTTEATGSPIAGQIAGMISPAAYGKAAQLATQKVSKADALQTANAERTANTLQGMEAGYVFPPSINRPTMLSRALESLGGKAAVSQEAKIRNQEVTNQLVRRDIGLNENQPITENALEKLREKYSQPYKDVSELPPLTVWNSHLTQSNTFNPKQMVDDLKTTRAEANKYYKAYSRDLQPETLKQAQSFKAQASQLEADLERVAQEANKPKLVNQLRQARQQIAKTYTVEDALNVGATNVSARDLGRNLDKGVPLSGNLKDIALFAEANPNYVGESSTVSTPGVSLLDAYASAAGMASKNPMLGGLPLLRGPARSLVLSAPYQKAFAKPDYSASALAKMLSKYNPSDADIKAMQAALLLSRSEAQ